MITEMISAIGYDHHTISGVLNIFANAYATGMIMNNCLAIDIIMLYTPFPKAWNTQLEMMQYPAKTKLRLSTAFLKKQQQLWQFCS